MLSPMRNELEAAQEAARRIKDQALPPVPCFWPKTRPRYLVEIYLRDTGAAFECARVDITALTGAPVTTRALRNMPTATLVSEAIHSLLLARVAIAQDALETPPLRVFEFDVSGKQIGEAPPDEAFLEGRRARWEAVAEEAAQRMSVGITGEGHGRRYPPGHLKQVAQLVRDAQRRGEPIQAAVSDTFGITRGAAANQIARARAAGLLDAEKEED
jgi:hypothetical protein